MAESIETSDIANKSFYSSSFVLLFIVKRYEIKNFKFFSYKKPMNSLVFNQATKSLDL